MPVAHYKIDFSLLVLRTCSIFACQWGLRRGEMRLKLLLIDVVDSLASFTLHCLQQVSERSSNHAGGFLQRSSTHPFLSPSDLPCSVPHSEKSDQLWCRALPSEPPLRLQGHRGMSVLFTDMWMVSHCETICPWLDRTCRWLCSGDPWALCLWPSAQPKSRSNTCEKQWRSTANEIPLNCHKITKRLLHRFQEEKDAVSPKMTWISEAQVKHPLKTLNLTWIRTRDWGPCLAYVSFIPYLVLKSTQKTRSPSHSLQQQWSQGRGKYKAGRSPANSFCYQWK